jgi:hypothetical protein
VQMMERLSRVGIRVGEVVSEALPHLARNAKALEAASEPCARN